MNIDKVIEQIEELKELDMCDFGKCPPGGISCQNCEKERILKKVIEIVRRGGVDEI